MSKKVQELRSLPENELEAMKKELQEKLMQNRFRSRMEKPKNIKEVSMMKKKIARINTLIREAELKGQ
ncbi:MAG: 50S ribosomal protein L29 [Brevinema sp.]